MILGFQKKYPWGGETNFKNKVLSSFEPSIWFPKLHTIRENKSGRWGTGVRIHFSTGVRTRDMDIFRLGDCSGVQSINIVHPKVFVGKKLLSEGEMIELSRNDGFDTIGDFWKWFDKPFKGTIIHWTEKRY